MAVQNSDILPYLLGIGALVMLLLNPIYSWLASQRNLRGVLIGCYSFFIINLLIFITLWEFFNLSAAIWLSQIFYIWCNVYSFFVVSIFWVVIINLFRGDNASKYFWCHCSWWVIGCFSWVQRSRNNWPQHSMNQALFFLHQSQLYF